MNYIILDMEWNQPVSKQRMVKTPVRLNGEIIQIGAVKVDECLRQIGSFNAMIAPKFYTKMNKYVENITQITNDDIREGVSFEQAITSFKNWCGQDSVILTWGPEDIPMLEKNLIAYNMDYSWIPESYDAQMIFDDQVTGEDRQFPLNYAIYYFGIKPKACHDALNDAINTAEVVKRLEIKAWIEENHEDDCYASI